MRFRDPNGRDWKDVAKGIFQGANNFVNHAYSGIIAAAKDPFTVLHGAATAIEVAAKAYGTAEGRAQMAGQWKSMNQQEKTSVVTEVVLTGATAGALKAQAQSAASVPEAAAAQATTEGATYYHYGYMADEAKFADGLRAGSFATTDGTLTGTEAQSTLALPRPTAPDAVYPVTPEAGTPITGPSTVQPANGQPGLGQEVQFPQGTGAGTVGPPRPIPNKIDPND